MLGERVLWDQGVRVQTGKQYKHKYGFEGCLRTANISPLVHHMSQGTQNTNVVPWVGTIQGIFKKFLDSAYDEYTIYRFQRLSVPKFIF